MKSWTDLNATAEIFSVFHGVERAKGDLDPLFVVPSDVDINLPDELFDSDVLPISRIDDIRFKRVEESFGTRRCMRPMPSVSQRRRAELAKNAPFAANIRRDIRHNPLMHGDL